VHGHHHGGVHQAGGLDGGGLLSAGVQGVSDSNEPSQVLKSKLFLPGGAKNADPGVVYVTVVGSPKMTGLGRLHCQFTSRE
jgi:hypothetical protein